MEFGIRLKFIWCTVCVGSIPIVSARDNIALVGTAEQSSINHYGYPDYFYWVASLAIDGDISERQYIDFEPRCSGTLSQNTPWWRVDLRAQHQVANIKVYGRLTNPEQLRGFRLYVTSSGPNDVPDEDLVYADSVTEAEYYANNAIYNIYINRSRRGRYVHIALKKAQSHLVLCEVEVYEACPQTFYGENCLDICGSCKNNVTCNYSDGTCPDGCAPGFLPNMCTAECPDESYGHDCRSQCGHCKDNIPCDKVNGYCSKCAPGYHGIFCLKECDDFTYGDGCQSQCGHCKDNATCDHITGNCSRCEAGFTGGLCDTACSNGRYGEGCMFSCGQCKGDSVCDKVNGYCSSCAAGYRGPKCQSECSNYTYGENCIDKCGFCRNGNACNPVTGHCIGCKDGYLFRDKFCKTECTDGKFGYKCRYDCGKCKNGYACNKTNGVCSLGCAAGYEEIRCKKS